MLLEFSDKYIEDVRAGKADYVREDILHFNSIMLDKTCLAIRVDGAVVARFVIPKGTNFERGESVIFDITDGMMSIRRID